MAERDDFNLEVFEGLVDDAQDWLEATPPPHDGRTRWANSDFYSLNATLNLEEFIAGDELRTLPFSDQSFVHGLTDWRKALPFSDGERARLMEVKHAHPVSVHIASIIRQEVSAEPIEDAGIVTYTSGKRLMQTWWKWRRGIGERFDGQNGPERAIHALWLARKAINEMD
jgi:hypothetical protein